MATPDSDAARVLLVEDDDGYAKTVVQILSDMDLTHVASYEEALRLVRELDSFDCALVDLNLIDDNDGRGRSVIAALKRRRADFPVAALTAFDPGIGKTLETTLREIGADDIVKKSGDPHHGHTLRATVDRLLDGELQPLAARRMVVTLDRIANISRSWQERQARAEQWRIIVRRHFGSDRVRYLSDPLVRVSEGARVDLSAIERDVLQSVGRRGSVDAVNRAGEQVEALSRRHDASWVEVVTIDDGVQWIRRLACSLVRLDLTVMIVLAGVFLALSGGVITRWKLDHAHLSTGQVLLLGGGLVTGVATAALAGAGQKIHSRVQEAWAGTGDAFKVEELLAASLRRRLVGISLALILGLGFLISAFLVL